MGVWLVRGYMKYIAKYKGKDNDCIQQVFAGVHSARSARSHELYTLGATVIEMNHQNESLLHDIVKNAKGTVIIPPYENRPDWDRKMQMCLEHLQKCSPSVVVLLSCAAVGAMDNIKEQPSAAEFKKLEQVENKFKEIGKNKKWSIVRHDLPQEFLLHYSRLIQETGTLMLPTGNGKCPYVSIKDITMAVSCLIHTPKSFNTYTVTGPESLSGSKLVDYLNKEVHGQFSFKEVREQYAERYLRTEFSEKSSALVHLYLGNFELIKNGKLEKPTEDFKKITGQQPRQVDSMIKNFAQLFRP
jgi:hypothetical protein